MASNHAVPAAAIVATIVVAYLPAPDTTVDETADDAGIALAYRVCDSPMHTRPALLVVNPRSPLACDIEALYLDVVERAEPARNLSRRDTRAKRSGADAAVIGGQCWHTCISRL